MKHAYLRRFLCTAIIAAGFGAGSTAMAKQTISLALHNDTPDSRMTCQVHKVVTNTAGRDVETLLKTYNVKPKNQRSQSVRNKPQNFSLAVKYIIKRLDGSVVYPRLKLTCELAGANSRNHSPEWNNVAKPFRQHRFFGSCRSGAYCTARVDRR